MGVREFIESNLDTFGVSAVFATLGSGFLLWKTAQAVPVTAMRAFMVIFSGLVVAAVATSFCVGYLKWDPTIAPFIGIIAGIIGIFALSTGVKVGQQVENRGDDIADRGIDIIAHTDREDRK